MGVESEVEGGDLVYHRPDLKSLLFHPTLDDLIQFLLAQGFRVFIVGGAVRDVLWGVAPQDWDLVVSGPLEQVDWHQVPKARVLPVGRDFGVWRVIWDKLTVDIASWRQDGPYGDGRRPLWVQEGSLETDAARRDFTVNALYFEWANQCLWDPTGLGLRDVEARRWVTVGRPQERFQEDHLRILRLMRFYASWGGQIDTETFQAAISLMPLIQKVAKPRIIQEWDKAFENYQAWVLPSKTLFDLVSAACRALWQVPLVHQDMSFWWHQRVLTLLPSLGRTPQWMWWLLAAATPQEALLWQQLGQWVDIRGVRRWWQGWKITQWSAPEVESFLWDIGQKGWWAWLLWHPHTRHQPWVFEFPKNHFQTWDLTGLGRPPGAWMKHVWRQIWQAHWVWRWSGAQIEAHLTQWVHEAPESPPEPPSRE